MKASDLRALTHTTDLLPLKREKILVPKPRCSVSLLCQVSRIGTVNFSFLSQSLQGLYQNQVSRTEWKREVLLIFWLAKLVLKECFTLGVPVHQANADLFMVYCRACWLKTGEEAEEFADIVIFFNMVCNISSIFQIWIFVLWVFLLDIDY